MTDTDTTTHTDRPDRPDRPETLLEEVTRQVAELAEELAGFERDWNRRLDHRDPWTADTQSVMEPLDRLFDGPGLEIRLRMPGGGPMPGGWPRCRREGENRVRDRLGDSVTDALIDLTWDFRRERRRLLESLEDLAWILALQAAVIGTPDMEVAVRSAVRQSGADPVCHAGRSRIHEAEAACKRLADIQSRADEMIRTATSVDRDDRGDRT